MFEETDEKLFFVFIENDHHILGITGSTCIQVETSYAYWVYQNRCKHTMQVCIFSSLVVAMFEPPTPPLSRGPNREWTISYVKSLNGIVKIVEMVRKVHYKNIQF